MSIFSWSTRSRAVRLALASCGAAAMSTVLILTMTAHPEAQQPQTSRRPQGYIGGTVESSKGREAGVWVIAETTELPTKFVKIVVTGDDGRFMLPEMPNATYSVWVRGYGLVDSAPITARPGQTIAL